MGVGTMIRAALLLLVLSVPPASAEAAGTWTAKEPTGCITACGTAEGSGTPGAVTCSTGSDAGCNAAVKPALKTCPATPDCGTAQQTEGEEGSGAPNAEPSAGAQDTDTCDPADHGAACTTADNGVADSVAGDDMEAARAAALAHELEAEATVAQVNTEVEVEVAKVAPVAAEAGEQPSEGAPLEAQPTGGGEEQATSSKAGETKAGEQPSEGAPLEAQPTGGGEEQATSSKAGENGPEPVDDPYAILGIDKTASATQIRKAYRKLSMVWHPDRHAGKNQSAQDDATAKFAEIANAYDLIGTPDRRATFDDFGKEGTGGFRSWAEYMASASAGQASKDLYHDDSHVSRLTESLWNERVKGETPWVVEFYAPWCTHCMESAKIFRQIAETLEGVAEFGAVNCASEGGKPICERNHVQIYPSFLVFSPLHQSQATFHDDDTYQTIREIILLQIPGWVKSKVDGWTEAFAKANATSLSSENFAHEVMGTDDIWFVLWTNGGHADVASREHTPNFLRFAADVTAYAHAGIADCQKLASLGDQLCTEQNVTGEFPAFWSYSRGGPNIKKTGERLFSASEVPPHIYFPGAVKLLRIAAPLPEIDERFLCTAPSSGWWCYLRTILPNSTNENALDITREKEDDTYEEPEPEQPETPPDFEQQYEAPNPTWSQRHMMVDDGRVQGAPMLGGG